MISRFSASRLACSLACVPFFESSAGARSGGWWRVSVLAEAPVVFGRGAAWVGASPRQLLAAGRPRLVWLRECGVGPRLCLWLQRALTFRSSGQVRFRALAA
jgi:hypothetical protein